MLSSLLLSLTAVVSTPAPLTTVAPALVATAASQPVKLVARDKVELAATYFPPRDMKTKNTAVLMVHGAGKDAATLTSLAEAWQKKGAAVMTLDLRGHGESASEKSNWETATEKEREVLWAMAKRDLEAAEAYLRDRTEVHAARIIVLGLGTGSGLAARYGIEGTGVAGVVMIDPPVEKEQTFGIDLEGALAELEGLPALVVCTKVTRKACDAMAKTAHERNDGFEYIELGVLRCGRGEELTDKRIASVLIGWTKEQIEKGG